LNLKEGRAKKVLLHFPYGKGISSMILFVLTRENRLKDR
jgi:chemotaxis protein CheY-P-specific phosphatase CheC